MRLLPNGVIELLPAAAYDGVSIHDRQLFGHRNGRYGFVIVELIDWLRRFIDNRIAIEIGAGAGDLCHYLGIRGTDSYMQEWPEVQAFYKATGQPTVKYASWVERIAALDAVKKYQPQVVVGSWITHWIDPDLPPPPGGGSVYGVREDRMLRMGIEAYVMIGNVLVHRNKSILYDHPGFDLEVLEFEFVKSRASQPSADRIFVWKRK